MKFIIKVLSLFFSSVLKTIPYMVLLIVLIMSVRGNIGNPSSDELTFRYWREDGPFELSPERGRFGLLYSLIEDRSFYFSVDLARFIVPDLGYINGHYVSLFAPAVSFISMPGYLVGKYFGASQVGAYAVISIFGLINLVLIKEIVKSLAGKSVSGWISGMIFLFATPAYAYAVNLYQHHISTFLILLSTLIILRSKKTWPLFFVWFLCAMSIPVDYPNLFLMFPIGICGLTKIFELKGSSSIYNIKFNILSLTTFIGLIVPLIFFAWFNNKSYGNPFQFSGTVPSARAIDEFGKPTSPVKASVEDLEWYAKPENQEKSSVGFFKARYILNGLYIHLLSPDRGLIYFTPVILFGIFGIVILQRKKHEYLPMLLGIIFANVTLYSMWGDPWGGWAFGSRYLIPSYAIMSIFIGVALSKFRTKWLFLIPFYIVLIYSVLVNTLGALTTSANPPKVEVLSLEKVSGKRERYSYDRNWEFLNSGKSKSFIYQTLGKNYINSMEYYYVISGTIIFITTSLLIFLILKKDEIKN